jgi:hypothetical protein
MREFHLIDKSTWGQGPWMQEPDYILWVDFDTFYACVARRNVLGAWCGYVGLPLHHPLYRTPADDRSFEFIDCHGGISYAGFLEEDSKQFSPPVRLWWVGFSAMEESDMLPEILDRAPSDAEKSRPKVKRRKKGESLLAYRDLDFIKNEIALLAMQLSNLDAKIVLSDTEFKGF